MTDRWRQVERLRQVLPRVRVTDATAISAPVVHRADSTVWTESGDGHKRCWHVAGDGSLHETPESIVWSAERAAERAVRGQW